MFGFWKAKNDSVLDGEVRRRRHEFMRPFLCPVLLGWFQREAFDPTRCKPLLQPLDDAVPEEVSDVPPYRIRSDANFCEKGGLCRAGYS